MWKIHAGVLEVLFHQNKIINIMKFMKFNFFDKVKLIRMIIESIRRIRAYADKNNVTLTVSTDSPQICKALTNALRRKGFITEDEMDILFSGSLGIQLKYIKIITEGLKRFYEGDCIKNGWPVWRGPETIVDVFESYCKTRIHNISFDKTMRQTINKNYKCDFETDEYTLLMDGFATYRNSTECINLIGMKMYIQYLRSAAILDKESIDALERSWIYEFSNNTHGYTETEAVNYLYNGGTPPFDVYEKITVPEIFGAIDDDKRRRKKKDERERMEKIRGIQEKQCAEYYGKIIRQKYQLEDKKI